MAAVVRRICKPSRPPLERQSHAEDRAAFSLPPSPRRPPPRVRHPPRARPRGRPLPRRGTARRRPRTCAAGDRAARGRAEGRARRRKPRRGRGGGPRACRRRRPDRRASLPARTAGGRGAARPPLRRTSQRAPPRPLRGQRRRPPLRLQPVRGGRRPPHLSLLRRARLQGALPAGRHRAARAAGRFQQPDRAGGGRARRAHRPLRPDAAALDLSLRPRRRPARGVGGAAPRHGPDPHLARAGQGAPHRARARGGGRGAPAPRGLLRHPVPLREARPGRRARLRGRGDGERGRGVLPRDTPPPRPGDRVAQRAQAGGRGDRPRARAHVVRRPRHHGVVGRPLAERGVRHLDGLPRGRRLAPGVAALARVRARPGRRARARRARQHAPDLWAGAPRRRDRWPLPLVVRWRTREGATGLDRLLVDRAADGVKLAAEMPLRWYFGNAGAGGFYRALHDPADQSALLEDLAALSAVERLALANDQWALVRAAKATIESFLEVTDALGDETDYDVLDGLAGPLALVDEQIVEPDGVEQARFRGWIARRFGPALARRGWTPAADEDDPTRLRRAALLRLVGGVAEAPAVLAEARARLDGYLRDRGTLDPNLADPVVGLAARVGDEALYDTYRRLVAEARTPQERRRFLLGPGAFRTPETIRRTLAATLSPDIPTQDVAFIFMRLLGNPAGRSHAWKFLTRRWSALRRRIPPLMISRLVEALPALREPRAAREVRAFFAAHPVPEASRALKQTLEVFRLNAELRRRTAPGLARWLAGHAA